MPIRFSDDPADDELVNTDPLAFLIAMLLDQQIPLSWAFDGPNRIVARMGCPLDAHVIATEDPDAFAALAAESPALHRYHRSMAGRVQALCAHLVTEHDGDAGAIWRSAESGREVIDRLLELPGFGDEKARITLAALVKRFGHEFPGWEDACAPFGDDQPRSVADIGSPADFERVKAWKKAQKQAGLDKQDPSVSG